MTADLRHLDYSAAREAEEVALEAAAGTRLPGEDRDRSGFYAHAGDGGAQTREPLTWQRWLRQTRTHAPSPADHAALEVAEAAALQDAHAAAEELRDLYERACAARGAVMAMMHAQGRTYADIGALVGIGRNAALKAVQAYERRGTSMGGEDVGDPW